MCGRIFKAHVPKGGDGSQWNPARHKDKLGGICKGSHDVGETIKSTPTEGN